MKYFIKKARSIFLIAALLVGSIASFTQPLQATAASGSPLVSVQLLGINDLHGQLDIGGTSSSWKDSNGKQISGIGYLASNLNIAEQDFIDLNPGATSANSIRVQSGDMVGASPAISGLLQDEPVMLALKKMNFQVGTLGNHEFDEGLSEYKRILDGVAPTPGKFSSIVDQYTIREKSSMEIVISNVVNKSDGKTPTGFKPYTIKEVEGIKIGFIGVLTTEMPNLALAQNIQDYKFLDEAESIAKYAKILRETEDVNAIVVLAHNPSSSPTKVGTVTGTDAVTLETKNIMDKVNALYPDNSVDVVFAGHNHAYTNGYIENTAKGTKTLVVQTMSQGKVFADVQGQLDPDTGDFASAPVGVIKWNTQDGVTPDPVVEGIRTDAYSRTLETLNAKIGYTESGNIVRTASKTPVTGPWNMESPLGNLITDAQRYMAEKAGQKVDFAFTNNGGIRADLQTTLVDGKHTISWGQAYSVQPFGNIMQVLEMKGQDIIDVLRESYQNNTYWLQVSGLKYYATQTPWVEGSKFSHEIGLVVMDNGQIIDPNGTYRVIVNDFLFGGGDGFTVFKNKGKLVGVVQPDTDTFVGYIQDLASKGLAVKTPEIGRQNYKTKTEVDQIAAQTVSSRIAALPTATVANKAPYLAAQAQYNLLSDAQKALVTDYKKVADGLKTIAALETELPKTGESFTELYILLGFVTILSTAIVYERRRRRV